jgi:hypothetical protein
MRAIHVADSIRFRSAARAMTFAFAAIVSWSCTAAAQDSALTPGSRIRIQSADDKQIHEGTFRALTPDSLVYSPGLATSIESLPLSSVGKIEVSRYNLKARSVLTDAAIGTGIGLGGTLAVGGACAVFHSDCFVLIFAAPALIGGGFLAGALIGSQNRGQHWDQVYPSEQSANLLIGPMPHGRFALGLSVPFGSAPAR